MAADADPTRPARRRPQPLILAVIVVVILALGSWLVIRLVTGVEQGSDGTSSVHCLPAPLTVSNSSPAAGETIELTSASVDCGLTFPGTAHYDIALRLVGRGDPIPLAHAVQVRGDGGFATELTIPADASPGEAYIMVSGSAYDDCDDTNASCAGYDAAITIVSK